MTLISGALSAEEESNTGWSTLFTQGKERYFQRLCLGVVGLSLLQWSGEFTPHAWARLSAL